MALYDIGRLRLLTTKRWDTHVSVGLLLVTSTYTFDRSHVDVADVTGECSGGGYARLTTLANRTVTTDSPNHRVLLDADDVVFAAMTSAAGIPAAIIVYDDTSAADADKELFGHLPLPGDDASRTPDGTAYNIAWNSAGLWAVY